MSVARVKGVFGMTTANHLKLIKELTNEEDQSEEECNQVSLLLEENVRDAEIAIATEEGTETHEENTVVHTRDKP